MIENTISMTTPAEAVAGMCDRLAAVDAESVPLVAAAGRVTAEAIISDRPSPPSDVSAMDGYAVRLADVKPGRLDVAASILPGQPAMPMPSAAAVRVMTGAVVPEGAEAVIMRERVEEHVGHIMLPDSLDVQDRQNIRYRGENLAANIEVLAAGHLMQPAVTTAAASFGYGQLQVHRRVKVAMIVTGDELLPPHAGAEDWEIRDSNGPAIASLLSPLPWVRCVTQMRVRDEMSPMLDAIQSALADADALFLTGGVSAGTHDFVPDALREAGCEIIFHRLPQRPGRPLLGAIGPNGQAVLGLPGNPQSVMCCVRRIGMSLLRKCGGFGTAIEPRPQVNVTNDDGKTLGLWWMRPVRLTGGGNAELIATKGSGDVVGSARSDGFVEIPPGRAASGSLDYYGWAS